MNLSNFSVQLDALKKATDDYEKAKAPNKETMQLQLMDVLETTCTILCVGDEKYLRGVKAPDLILTLERILRSTSFVRVEMFTLRCLSLVGSIIPRGGVDIGRQAKLLVPKYKEFLLDVEKILGNDEFCEELLRCVCFSAPFCHEAYINEGIPSALISLDPLLGEFHLQKLCLRAIISTFECAQRGEAKTIIAATTEFLQNAQDTLQLLFRLSGAPDSPVYTSTSASAPPVHLEDSDVVIVQLHCSALCQVIDRILVNPATLKKHSLVVEMMFSYGATLLENALRAPKHADKFILASCSIFLHIYLTDPSQGMKLLLAHRVLHTVCRTMLGFLNSPTDVLQGQDEVQNEDPFDPQEAVQEEDDSGVPQGGGEDIALPDLTPGSPQARDNQAQFDLTQDTDDGPNEEGNNGNGGAGSTQQLLSDDVTTMPLIADELSIVPLLEFLLVLFPPSNSPFGHADSDCVTLPFHSWCWEDDFHNTGDCAENLSYRLDLEYLTMRAKGSWSSSHLLQHLSTKRPIFVDFAGKWYQTGGSSFPHPFRREGIMAGFLHHRYQGLESGCQCIEGDLYQVSGQYADPLSLVDRDNRPEKNTSKGCCRANTVTSKGASAPGARSFGDPEKSSKSTVLTDYRVLLMLDERTREVFLSEDVLNPILSHCLPTLITIAKNTVNPVVARHLSVIILRILCLTTELCCGPFLQAKKNKRMSFYKKNKNGAKAVAEKLQYQMGALTTTLTYLYRAKMSSTNEIGLSFGAVKPFRMISEDQQLRNILDLLGIIGREYETFNYTYSGEISIAAADSILLLFFFTNHTGRPCPLTLPQLEMIEKTTGDRIEKLQQFIHQQSGMFSTMSEAVRVVKKRKFRVAPAPNCPFHHLLPVILDSTQTLFTGLAEVVRGELLTRGEVQKGSGRISLTGSSDSLGYPTSGAIQPRKNQDNSGLNPFSIHPVDHSFQARLDSMADVTSIATELRGVVALYDEIKETGTDIRVLMNRLPDTVNSIAADLEGWLRPRLQARSIRRLMQEESKEEEGTSGLSPEIMKKLNFLLTELSRSVGESLGLSKMNQIFPPLVTDFVGRYSRRYKKNKATTTVEELMWHPLVITFSRFRDKKTDFNKDMAYIVSEERREVCIQGQIVKYVPFADFPRNLFVSSFLSMSHLAYFVGRTLRLSGTMEEPPSPAAAEGWPELGDGSYTVASDRIIFFVDGVLVSNRLATVLNVLYAMAETGKSLRECLRAFGETSKALDGMPFNGTGNATETEQVFANALLQLDFFRARHEIEFLLLEKKDYRCTGFNASCGCIQEKCSEEVKEVLEENCVVPYCSPVHLFLNLKSEARQHYPALRLLQSLTLAVKNFDVESGGPPSPTSHSYFSFGTADGERRFSSALVHDLYNQISAFMLPPIMFHSLRGIHENKTLDGHVASFAVWNYPQIFPFEMRAALLELFISSWRRISPRVVKMVKGFSKKDVRLRFCGLNWLGSENVKEASGRYLLVVDRAHLITGGDVLRSLVCCPYDLDISFKGEKGIGPGPALEFYEELAKKIASPEIGAFKVNEVTAIDGTIRKETCPLLFPYAANPSSVGAYFELLGNLIGRLLMIRRTTQLRFHPLFLAAIRGDDITDQLERNMKLLDPELEKSIQMIEAMSEADLEAMDLNFRIDYFGKELPLVPGEGADAKVTRKNVKTYGKRLRRFHLTHTTNFAVERFKAGLSMVANPFYLKLFSVEELDTILSGPKGKIWETSAIFAKDVVTSHGYTRQSSVVIDLIDLIPTWDADMQRKFLKFLTGSSTLPLTGRLSNPITIVRRDADITASAIRPSHPPPSTHTSVQRSRPTSTMNSPARGRPTTLQASSPGRARSHGHRADVSGLDVSLLSTSVPEASFAVDPKASLSSPPLFLRGRRERVRTVCFPP